MDTINREEVKQIMASCAKMRKILAAMKTAVSFLDGKIAAIEEQGRRWDFRLKYKETNAEEIEEDEN